MNVSFYSYMCFEESFLVVADMVELCWCFDDKLLIYVNFILYLDGCDMQILADSYLNDWKFCPYSLNIYFLYYYLWWGIKIYTQPTKKSIMLTQDLT
jgi:hypothetical protein